MSETGKGEMREIYGQRERPLTPLAITQTGFIQQIPPYFSFPLALSQAAVSWSVSAEDQKEYLTIIRDESRRLADLATNILMLNRVESQSILTDKQRKRSPDTGCPVPGDLCLQNSDHSSKLGSSFRTWISSI